MPNVLLLQFATDPESAKRREALGAAHVAFVEDEPRWPNFFDTVTARRPDAIALAFSWLPAYAREAARYLGEGFNTRDIPLLLVDVLPSERPSLEAYLRTYQPNARFVDRSELADAAARICSVA